jgi:uncharacterized protein YdaU (DUF1376 family)
VNYYRRYVGDYLRDTTRLSMLEHGAYNLLLDYYYAERKPLSLQVEEIYRATRALLPEERKAVDKVLARYFEKRKDGYHNPRADQELGKFAHAIEKMSEAGSQGAKARWGKDRVPHKNPNEVSDGVAMQPPTSNLQPPASSLQSTNLQQRQKPIASSAKALSASGNGGARCSIPLNDGTEYPITEEIIAELSALYPAVDVPQTLNEIRGWNLSKPERRKTRRGVMAHINSWMAREQNRGPKN